MLLEFKLAAIFQSLCVYRSIKVPLSELFYCSLIANVVCVHIITV